MTDNVPVPIPANALRRGAEPEHYKRAILAQQREEKRERRFGNAKTVAILVLFVSTAGLIWRNDELAAKVSEVQVVYATLRDDGTLVSSARYSSLPPRVIQDNTLNSLWQYVLWRECYTASEAPRAYYAVQKMSDDRVRSEWVNYFSARNAESPQNTLGKRGFYQRCEPLSVAPNGRNGDSYNFGFERVTINNRGVQEGPAVTYTATVSFRTGIYDPNPADGWKDRTVFNAAGVQVWEYPGAKADSLNRALEARR